MMLSELMPGARLAKDVPITGLAEDSRDLAAGDVFFAYPGLHSDGRRFVGDALARGAAAVVCEKPGPCPAGVPVVEVENLKGALGEIASRYYGQPGGRMKIVAVTGTNGKTSCTHFVAQALGELGVKCGLVGTMGSGEPGKVEGSGLTTPPALRLQSDLRRLHDAGCTAVALEASSHGLDQGRLNGTEVDIAVLTNLTHDHLDYHGSVDAYAAAKAKLFRFASLAARVLNLDDDFGRRLHAEDPDAVTYGFGGDAGISVRYVHYLESGLDARIRVNGSEIDVHAPVYGACNLGNILAVCGVLLALGFGAAETARGLGALAPVTGRMHRLVGTPGKPAVFIDYAHTPDALRKCLEAVRQHFPGKQVTVVFGCGGDRDRAKRPLMGSIASDLANRLVLTSDNPREERADRIIDGILAGVSTHACLVEPDRERAIVKALDRSGAEDLVMIAGKGHENCQLIGDERVPFSDYDVVARALGR